MGCPLGMDLSDYGLPVNTYQEKPCIIVPPPNNRDAYTTPEPSRKNDTSMAKSDNRFSPTVHPTRPRQPRLKVGVLLPKTVTRLCKNWDRRIPAIKVIFGTCVSAAPQPWCRCRRKPYRWASQNGTTVQVQGRASCDAEPSLIGW